MKLICESNVPDIRGSFFFQTKSTYVFLTSSRKDICCGYSLEAPRWGTSDEYPQHIFSRRNKKNIHLHTPLIWSYAEVIKICSFKENLRFNRVHTQIGNNSSNVNMGGVTDTFKDQQISFCITVFSFFRSIRLKYSTASLQEPSLGAIKLCSGVVIVMRLTLLFLWYLKFGCYNEVAIVERWP